MRSASIVLALATVMAATLSFLPSEVRAPEPPKLLITVEAGVGPDFIFSPKTIVLPSVPMILNVTLVNNGTDSANTSHSFSINDNAGALILEIWANVTGERSSVEFAVNSTNQIYFRDQLYQAERSPAGGIMFYCLPHREGIGMVGNIVVGGVAGPSGPEIGVFLRAYWIGLIGLAAMLVWTGIAYFLIKATSRHHTDHREHVRRGLT